MCLLFLMALPLLLFLAVNFGWLPELRTDFFSIPRLPEIRTDEFSLSKMKAGFLWISAMLWRQHDDIWWITTPCVGAYYYISTPFILIGFFLPIKTLWDCIRKKKALPLSFLMTLWFLSMFLIGCTIDNAKYYKINCLHIPVIFYCMYGIAACLKYWKSIWVKGALAASYACFFLYFLYSQVTFSIRYENYGNPLLSKTLWTDYEEAVDYAETLTDGEIHIAGLNYVNLLLYKKMSPYDYMEQVVYSEGDQAFRTVSKIGRYHFDRITPDLTNDFVYIIPCHQSAEFLEAGYFVEQINNCYSVAYPYTS